MLVTGFFYASAALAGASQQNLALSIIQAFTLPDRNGLFIRFIAIEYGQIRCISATFIKGDDFRFAMVTYGFSEKAQCSCSIPFLRQQKINRLADCLVQVSNFNIGLIHSPAASHGTFMTAKGLVQS
ncbi:hypothetical protein BJK05_18160 [Pectobacterium polaris]|nr:hypothetical protein BJK05_18160 [Pectobacterium polaris]